jgi:aerobic carbon-monoxide dehydrogenase medium subunit
LLASDTELSIPRSAAEAVEAFGDGRGVTVFAGGTILMPELAHGRYPQAARTVMLGHAGLEGISGDGPTRVGAMTTLSTLAESGLEPLAAAAADVADQEIRAQATVGGNLCAPPGWEAPRGDLQAALLAIGAAVQFAGPGGERTESIDEFLGLDEPRLVLAVEFEPPLRAAYLSQRRPHAHSYAVMAVACAQGGDGVRVAAAGVAPRAVRRGRGEEALAGGAAAPEAAQHAADGLEPPDDALASSWYRKQVLPTLVRRALEQLQGG